MNLFRIVLGVASLSILLPLAAEDFDDDSSNLEHGQETKEVSLPAAAATEVRDTTKSISSTPLPSSDVFFARTSDGYRPAVRLMITQEYLCLTTREEGLGYGSTTGVSTLPANSNTALLTQAPAFVFAGEVRSVNPGFASGSRFNLFYSIPTNNWNVHVAWTWYANSSRDSTGIPIWPFWVNSGFTPLAGSATAQWNLHFNQIDGSIGGCCFANRFVRITPSIGVRGAWIYQNFDVTYNNLVFQASISTTRPLIQSNNQSKSAGVGLLGSLDVDWILGKGFSFYTNGAVALLWSSFNVGNQEILTDGSNRNTLSDPLNTTSPVLDLSLGVQWETTLSQDRYLLQIQLGWEEHLWFEQNQFARCMDSQDIGVYINTNGNLGLSGLTASLSFGF